MRMLLMTLILILVLHGCAAIPGGALAQSRIDVQTDMKKVDGTREKTRIRAQGEVAQTVSIEHQGESYGPDSPTDGDGNVWPSSPSMLGINSDSNVTSPQSLEFAKGLRVALEQTPQTVAELMSGITALNALPDDALPTPNFREMLLRGLLNRFLGQLANGAAPDFVLENLLER